MNTESFEQAMEIARHVMCEECELMDDFGSLCCEHERGCHDCELAMVARLKAAHNREIRDTAQQQYHRGFEAGQHSMDAEHRAIAARLRGLRFNGGSHENLSKIAYAIYPCATGWTCESADGLRDKLVDLMGGVSDGNLTKSPKTIKLSEPTTDQNHGNAKKPSITEVGDDCACAGRGACAVDCGCDSGEQEEVEHGGTADDSDGDSRGSYRGVSVHMDGLKNDGTCPDADGTCPNDDQTPSIAYELRGYVQDNECDRITLLSMPPQDEYYLTENGTRLLDIADRIDAAVKHEREADRLRIEKLVNQRDELRLIIADVVEERDIWKATADMNENVLRRIVGENKSLKTDCERLRKRLDSITEAIERIKSIGQE